MTSIMDDVRRDAINKLKQASLTSGDLRRLFLAVIEVCILSNIARNQGLLALEDAGNSLPRDIPCSPFLQSAVSKVVDGCEAEWIEEFLTTVYWVEKKENIEDVICYIYLRGLLMIQNGENPRMIEEILTAFIPDEFKEEFEEYKDERLNDLKRKEEERNTYLYNKIKLTVQDEEVRKLAVRLEEMLLGMDDRCIQRMLRDVDTCELSDAMTCLSKNVHEKLFDNMSYRLQKMILADIVNKIHCVSDTYYTNEQKAKKGLEKILYTIDLLEFNGVIGV